MWFLENEMPSTPAHTPSNAQPALRIPTFDSMKRFSAASDFSDTPDFDFTKTMDEDPLMLPDYLLKEIDVGQQGSGHQSLIANTDSGDNGTDPEVLFKQGRIQKASNRVVDVNGILEARDHLCSSNSTTVPARTSSKVPFNPSRPISQFSTNDGITALPTLASRGLLSGRHEDLPPTSRKRKASSALSGPIKRLRNLSLDTFTSKRHKPRGSSLSCMNDAATMVEGEKKAYGSPKAQLNTSYPSPLSVTRSTPTTFNTPTPTARYTNTLATIIIPTYPPSSSIQAPQPSSPGQLLLPDDMTCLTALQDVISSLHAENETLKQQVKMLREDWYATHDELLVERYEGWEKECELDKLRHSSELKDEDARIQANKTASKTPSGDGHASQAVDHQVEEICRELTTRGYSDYQEVVGVAR